MVTAVSKTKPSTSQFMPLVVSTNDKTCFVIISDSLCCANHKIAELKMLRGERKASSRVQSLDLRTAVCENITVSVDEVVFSTVVFSLLYLF